MIPLNLRHCNIFLKIETQKSSEEWIAYYYESVKKKDVIQAECNYCHCHGNCIRYGSYSRNYVLCPDELISHHGNQIRIQRIFCKHCGHTHALLPEEIIPYMQFNVVFVFLVLFLYYARPNGDKVSSICKDASITATQLYRWVKRFERQKDIFLGVVKSDRFSGVTAIKWLQSLSDYGRDFCGRYIVLTEKMPMQTHRNPPNTYRPVFQ